MKNLLIVFVVIFSLYSCNTIGSVNSDSKPVSHEKFDKLLKKHVNELGMVNYKGFIKDSLALNDYLGILRNNYPNEKNWSKDERLAYWINAYNAFTIQLIIRNYPVKSIKDLGGAIIYVNSPWDIKFIEIEGKTYDLNNLEHGIIRKEFDEPRIHFALVCAAMSCPRLRPEAYTAEKLDAQLNEEATIFFNNSKKNKITADSPKVSPLMKWYSGDFKKDGKGVIDFINKFSKIKINPKANLDYMDYDWSLNEQKS